MTLRKLRRGFLLQLFPLLFLLFADAGERLAYVGFVRGDVDEILIGDSLHSWARENTKAVRNHTATAAQAAPTMIPTVISLSLDRPRRTSW
jgi:hypothetical protein